MVPLPVTIGGAVNTVRLSVEMETDMAGGNWKQLTVCGSDGQWMPNFDIKPCRGIKYFI